MSSIAFKVNDREAVSNGIGMVSIGLLTSTKDSLLNNEMLNLLNTLKRSHYLDPSAHVGFDYTLDFPVVGREAFPYALDFILG